MNHDEIVARAEKWLLKTIGCGFCLTELRCLSMSGEIPDTIGWKFGASYLVECKATRNDFLSDEKKFFRRNSESGMGKRRYYMCPPGIIKPDEVPEKWGLLYVLEKSIKEIVEPVAFIGHEVASNEAPLLHSALRRVYKNGDLEKIYKKI